MCYMNLCFTYLHRRSQEFETGGAKGRPPALDQTRGGSKNTDKYCDNGQYIEKTRGWLKTYLSS